LLKSTDYQAKYEAAMKYFEKGDFYRAEEIYEGLVSVYKGSEQAETINYNLALCYMNQREYMSAGYYFLNFVKVFPNSTKAYEAQFNAGLCFYKVSPRSSLDESFTKKSIEEFQIFLNKYPDTDKQKECNDYIKELRAKLEKKSFDNAKLYYNLEDYKAAVVALKNSLKDYPDSFFREEILYYILKSSHDLALNSVSKKKNDRYTDTVDEYYAYIDQYPQGKYVKEAEKIFDNCNKYLKAK